MMFWACEVQVACRELAAALTKVRRAKHWSWKLMQSGRDNQLSLVLEAATVAISLHLENLRQPQLLHL